LDDISVKGGVGGITFYWMALEHDDGDGGVASLFFNDGVGVGPTTHCFVIPKGQFGGIKWVSSGGGGGGGVASRLSNNDSVLLPADFD